MASIRLSFALSVDMKLSLAQHHASNIEQFGTPARRRLSGNDELCQISAQ
jgi:hypothetical protein